MEKPTNDSEPFMYTPPMPQGHQVILAVACTLAGLVTTALTKKAYGEFVYKSEPIAVIPFQRDNNWSTQPNNIGRANNTAFIVLPLLIYKE